MTSAHQGQQKILFAEFTARPGHEEEVNELLIGLTQQVRQEPGCVAFLPHRLAENAAKFFVYEIYRDDAAFEQHISAPYGLEFNTRLTPLIEEDASQLTWLRSIE